MKKHLNRGRDLKVVEEYLSEIGESLNRLERLLRDSVEAEQRKKSEIPVGL